MTTKTPTDTTTRVPHYSIMRDGKEVRVPLHDLTSGELAVVIDRFRLQAKAWNDEAAMLEHIRNERFPQAASK